MQNAMDFEGMMRMLSALPLWVKQIIYTQLRIDLETTLSKRTLDMFGPDDLLQLLVPELTTVGNKELDHPSGYHSQDLLRFLHLCRQKKTIANIAILNYWTLDHTNNCLLQALNHQLVASPKSGTIKATIDYLAGNTRLGEYLVKINRLTMEQLDQALRTQKYIEESMGDKTGIANVLTNLGYIKKEDSEGILFLKEESMKPFEGFNAPSPVNGAAAAPHPTAPVASGVPKTPPVPVHYPRVGAPPPSPHGAPPAAASHQQSAPPLPPPGASGNFSPMPPPDSYPPPPAAPGRR